jgi:hypothetical protein
VTKSQVAFDTVDVFGVLDHGNLLPGRQEQYQVHPETPALCLLAPRYQIHLNYPLHRCLELQLLSTLVGGQAWGVVRLNDLLEMLPT